MEQDRSFATPRVVALLAGALVMTVVVHLAGVVVPFLVNGSDRVPLAEVAGGAHDPKDLWPRGDGGRWVAAAGLSVVLGPAVLAILAATSVALSRGVGVLGPSPRPTRAVAAGLWAVAAVSLAALASAFTPLGPALASWRLD